MSSLSWLEKRSYYYRRHLKLNRISKAHCPDRQTIVIYQMGKVGSSTIEYSLAALDLDVNLYHVHALTHQRLDWLKDTFRKASRERGKAIVHDHLAESMFLRQQLDRNSIRDYKVITLIRDPVARNISTYFESFNILFAKDAKKYNFDISSANNNLDDIIQLFIQEANHELPLVWFDRYMAPVFDIDVYSEEFPKDKGYSIYKSDNAELLLMRLEDLNRCAKDAFKEYLGLDDFKLKKANVASEKNYSGIYSEFQDSIKLPEQYLENIYNARFTRHFYSSSEIDEFMRRWTR